MSISPLPVALSTSAASGTEYNIQPQTMATCSCTCTKEALKKKQLFLKIDATILQLKYML